MYLNNADTYKRQQVLTASPEKLILMLYNGCLKFINEARSGIEEKDILKTNTACQKAQDIVDELVLSLNMDIEISKELARLYEYVNYEIIQANLKKDVVHLDNAKLVIGNIREGWTAAMKTVSASGTQPQKVSGDSVISI